MTIVAASIRILVGGGENTCSSGRTVNAFRSGRPEVFSGSMFSQLVEVIRWLQLTGRGAQHPCG